MTDRCPTCDRVLADIVDLFPDGTCADSSLCLSALQRTACANPPVDWRARALAARRDCDSLSANWAACEAENDRLKACIAALESALGEALEWAESESCEGTLERRDAVARLRAVLNNENKEQR